MPAAAGAGGCVAALAGTSVGGSGMAVGCGASVGGVVVVGSNVGGMFVAEGTGAAVVDTGANVTATALTLGVLVGVGTAFELRQPERIRSKAIQITMVLRSI